MFACGSESRRLQYVCELQAGGIFLLQPLKCHAMACALVRAKKALSDSSFNVFVNASTITFLDASCTSFLDTSHTRLSAAHHIYSSDRNPSALRDGIPVREQLSGHSGIFRCSLGVEVAFNQLHHLTAHRHLANVRLRGYNTRGCASATATDGGRVPGVLL